MKNSLLLAAGIAALLSSCSNDPLVPAWMRGDWKCAVRDSNGNPYFGVAKDKKAAVEKARWQCVSGSPYKQSCNAETSHCEQLE
ncbi:MAG: hypothetical protein MUF20_11250 [Methylotetracoccus sp.]|jgi:hypothetical protein|nr:hypothetical protein [Methylotetracoccus sp.]